MAEAKKLTGVDEGQLTSTWLTGGKIDLKWFQKGASKVFSFLKDLATFDLRQWLKDVKGGAIEVWKAIKGGNWKLFKDWFKEAPILPKMAATVAVGITAGVVVLVGGAALGMVGAGIASIMGGLGVGGTLALAAVMPGLMSKVVQATSFAYNFDWNVSDKKLYENCKTALENLYEPFGEAIGRSLAALIVGKAASPPQLELNQKHLACIWLINENIREELVDAITELRVAVRFAATNIAFMLSYSNVRKIAADFFDKENQWGKEGSEPFVFSQKVEKVYEKVKTSEFFSWVNEKQWEGFETGVEAFFETLGDLLTDQSTYETWVSN